MGRRRRSGRRPIEDDLNEPSSGQTRFWVLPPGGDLLQLGKPEDGPSSHSTHQCLQWQDPTSDASRNIEATYGISVAAALQTPDIGRLSLSTARGVFSLNLSQ